MSRWFRLYDELLDDPKVQRLSGDDFKAWVNILCLASRNDGNLPPAADIAFALRLEPRKATAILSRLIAAGLMDEVDGALSPHGWNARQYKSDVSTDRVKRFRERKKGVSGNGDETFHATPPDTDTETDVSVDKSTGENSPSDPDAKFWADSKAFLASRGVKNPGGVVGKWVRDHGKRETASAVSRAQIERAVEPVSFVQACFREATREAAEVPLC